jgi:hypothetical protein
MVTGRWYSTLPCAHGRNSKSNINLESVGNDRHWYRWNSALSVTHGICAQRRPWYSEAPTSWLPNTPTWSGGSGNDLLQGLKMRWLNRSSQADTIQAVVTSKPETTTMIGTVLPGIGLQRTAATTWPLRSGWRNVGAHAKTSQQHLANLP